MCSSDLETMTPEPSPVTRLERGPGLGAASKTAVTASLAQGESPRVVMIRTTLGHSFRQRRRIRRSGRWSGPTSGAHFREREGQVLRHLAMEASGGYALWIHYGDDGEPAFGTVPKDGRAHKDAAACDN